MARTRPTGSSGTISRGALPSSDFPRGVMGKTLNAPTNNVGTSTSIATDMEGTQELGEDVLDLTERFRTRLRRMGEGVGDFVFPEGGA